MTLAVKRRPKLQNKEDGLLAITRCRYIFYKPRPIAVIPESINLDRLSRLDNHGAGKS
jgi:hypothetical protein